MATYDDYYKTLNTGVARNLPKTPVTSSVADRVGFHYKNPYSYDLPVNIPNSAPIKRERSTIDRFFDVLVLGIMRYQVECIMQLTEIKKQVCCVVL